MSILTDLDEYNEPVTNVSESTRDFLWARHRRKTLQVCFIALAISAPLLILSPWALLILFGIPFSLYGWVKAHMKAKFFTQIAAELGMAYTPYLNLDKASVSGHLFSLGKQKTLWHILAGTYRGTSIRLYEYSFVTGTGKNKTTHNFVISEIDAQKPLPGLWVKPDWKFVSLGTPQGFKSLSLEGGFNNHFDVSIPEDGHIGALRILEPDVMELFLTDFKDFGFECSGTKLYLFTSGSFASNRAHLLDNIKLLERLYDELIPELEGVARSH